MNQHLQMFDHLMLFDGPTHNSNTIRRVWMKHPITPSFQAMEPFKPLIWFMEVVEPPRERRYGTSLKLTASLPLKIGAPLEVWRFRTWKPPFSGAVLV